MRRSPRLSHPVLLYGDEEEFVAGTVPFVRRGIENDEVVFVAARPDYLDTVRAELGADASAATWKDTHVWHPHHASRLRAVHELVSGAPRGSRLRLVGEPIWPERPEEVLEWQRFESALNAVLAPFPASLLCLYDAGSLDPGILETAGRTHPGAGYEEPETFLRAHRGEPFPPPRSAEVVEHVRDPAWARGLALDRAIRAGVGGDAAVGLSIAVNEVLMNALLHGGGEASLSMWEEGASFVCQVEDEGPGIADPLAGYRPPANRTGGRGLWIARQ
ncbi:MAG TPA: anti-sigma factor RsbA family regulatory protein, partial [Actinomycetota bacterium]